MADIKIPFDPRTPYVLGLFTETWLNKIINVGKNIYGVATGYYLYEIIEAFKRKGASSFRDSYILISKAIFKGAVLANEINRVRRAYNNARLIQAGLFKIIIDIELPLGFYIAIGVLLKDHAHELLFNMYFRNYYEELESRMITQEASLDVEKNLPIPIKPAVDTLKDKAKLYAKQVIGLPTGPENAYGVTFTKLSSLALPLGGYPFIYHKVENSIESYLRDDLIYGVYYPYYVTSKSNTSIDKNKYDYIVKSVSYTNVFFPVGEGADWMRKQFEESVSKESPVNSMNDKGQFIDSVIETIDKVWQEIDYDNALRLSAEISNNSSEAIVSPVASDYFNNQYNVVNYFLKIKSDDNVPESKYGFYRDLISRLILPVSTDSTLVESLTMLSEYFASTNAKYNTSVSEVDWYGDGGVASSADVKEVLKNNLQTISNIADHLRYVLGGLLPMYFNAVTAEYNFLSRSDLMDTNFILFSMEPFSIYVPELPDVYRQKMNWGEIKNTNIFGSPQLSEKINRYISALKEDNRNVEISIYKDVIPITDLSLRFSDTETEVIRYEEYTFHIPSSWNPYEITLNVSIVDTADRHMEKYFKSYMKTCYYRGNAMPPFDMAFVVDIVRLGADLSVLDFYSLIMVPKSIELPDVRYNESPKERDSIEISLSAIGFIAYGDSSWFVFNESNNNFEGSFNLAHGSFVLPSIMGDITKILASKDKQKYLKQYINDIALLHWYSVSNWPVFLTYLNVFNRTTPSYMLYSTNLAKDIIPAKTIAFDKENSRKDFFEGAFVSHYYPNPVVVPQQPYIYKHNRDQNGNANKTDGLIVKDT
jgi:hypothetical protein